MTPEQLQEIEKLIEKTIEKRFDIWKGVLVTKLDAIITRLDQIAGVANLTNSDMGHDRESFANMRSEISSVDTRTRELVSIASNQTSRIAKDINNHADQAVEKAAQTVADQVEPAMAAAAKKIKNGKPLNDKPGFKFRWPRLKFPWKK